MGETTENAARELFDRALDADAAARQQILREAAAVPKDVHDRFRALLGAFERAGDFMREPTLVGVQSADARRDDAAVVLGASAEPSTEMIGPYRLLGKIGEGGFGEVFLAEQEQPLRRKVALKVIKLGMDTRRVVARFDGERQALALMDHPSIARVLDAGATPAGQPYFVMELVAGQPITTYCDETRLAMRGRIELFIRVCHAVQHAHQKGIVHRDIKPSNVLVGDVDGRPAPKVIDFGIAKAMGQEATPGATMTEVGQMIGTPVYMSPEQAAAGAVDVDTRSDVYSLGVLLYELLTGTTPFEGDSLRGASYSEIARIIREVEPARPSARIGGLAAAVAALTAERRGSASRRLGQSIQGEVDWIVMKCLEKERGRRYDSVGALAEDLGRYLNDEPVAAGPPSGWYRLRKFSRRNKGILSAAAAVAAALVIGLIFAAVALLRERDARAAAEEAGRKEVAQRTIAEKQTAAARHNEAIAKREADKSAAMNGFLLDVLTYADPSRGAGPQTTVLQMLDAAQAKLDATAAKQDEEVEAVIRTALGNSYYGLANYDKAKAQLTRAFDLRSSATPAEPAAIAESANNLANVLVAEGETDRAEALWKQSIEAFERLKDDQKASTVEISLGRLLAGTDRLPEAEAILRQSLDSARATARRDPARQANQLFLGQALVELATLNEREGKIGEAIPLLDESCRLLRDHLGPNYMGLATALNNLGAAKQRTHDLAGAEPLYAEALRIYKNRLPEGHPLIAKSTFNRALLLLDQNAPADVLEPAFADATALMRMLPLGDRGGIALCEDKYAAFSYREKKYERAAELWKAAYERTSPDARDSAHDYSGFRQAVARELVQLYEATNQKDEADLWSDRTGR